MINDNIKAWVAALRSGDYLQGHGGLRDPVSVSRFCVLGVACDVYRQATGNGRWVMERTAIPFIEGVSMSTWDKGLIEDLYWSRRMATRSVVDYFGLCCGRGSMRDRIGNINERLRKTLSALNDQGKTFDELADLIESGAYTKKPEQKGQANV